MSDKRNLTSLFLKAVKEVGNDIGFSVCRRVWDNAPSGAATYADEDIWELWSDEAMNVIFSSLRASVKDEIDRINRIRVSEDGR